MSVINKTPVSLLQEYCVRTHLPLPKYDYCQVTSTAQNFAHFRCTVTINKDIKGTGIGSSKQAAKQEGAKNVLDSLNIHAPPSEEEEASTPVVYMNAVGELNEFSSKNKLEYPQYKESTTEQGQFIIECRHMANQTVGIDYKKKQAKQKAASMMLESHNVKNKSCPEKYDPPSTSTTSKNNPFSPYDNVKHTSLASVLSPKASPKDIFCYSDDEENNLKKYHPSSTSTTSGKNPFSSFDNEVLCSHFPDFFSHKTNGTVKLVQESPQPCSEVDSLDVYYSDDEIAKKYKEATNSSKSSKLKMANDKFIPTSFKTEERSENVKALIDKFTAMNVDYNVTEIQVNPCILGVQFTYPNGTNDTIVQTGKNYDEVLEKIFLSGLKIYT